LSGDLKLPLVKLAAMSREAIQASDDIGRIYTQSAGLAHFVMDGECGHRREPFVDLLTAIYGGQNTAAAAEAILAESAEAFDRGYHSFLNVTDQDLASIPNPLTQKNLSLCRTKVTDEGLARFAGSRGLKWLDLSFTSTTDNGLKAFTANSGLKQLFLEGTKVTATSLPMIAAFRQLEELDLSGLPIADSDLSALRGLKQLEQLYCTGTQVTPEGYKRLRAALPKLRPSRE
jgi:hypothetical protein